ncbi:phage portal protein [Methylocella sp.]|uniref:phage portal protein n=1 Tax=Methylocella sp. TaxID=1978226 RepID=UPI0035B3ACC8
MAERGAGMRSWSLTPYDIDVRFASASAQEAGWFGPLEPMRPAAPVEIAGRQWDFPAGYNLSSAPRGAEPVTFDVLRGLADGYDLLRLVIETRKDQAARQSWTIVTRDRSAEAGADADRIGAAVRFFSRPDGARCFSDWLRMLLEEVFVTDAAALYMRRDRIGRLAALTPIDGATIKPVIDDFGRAPEPCFVDGELVYPTAYQQILKGVPAIDYTTRDLIYRPRNVRVNRVYGMSPVEQVITTVNIALRRQAYLMDYFTEGNIPDSLIGVPESWTPDQIGAYQKYWDAYFDGEYGRRRRAKFVPGGVAKTFIQTKEPELKSPFDEWLARVVCFAFSISPQALISTMNRATAQTQKELAAEEGLAPILAWVKALIDDVLAIEFDAPDLEFMWSAGHETDPLTQETILSNFTSKGILTINEARAALGRPPLHEPSADRPMTLTASGYVPLPD